jgi:hypothetical protein
MRVNRGNDSTGGSTIGALRGELNALYVMFVTIGDIALPSCISHLDPDGSDLKLTDDPAMKLSHWCSSMIVTIPVSF